MLDKMAEPSKTYAILIRNNLADTWTGGDKINFGLYSYFNFQ